MAENSAIEWTTHTFNPWIGCQKVGPGCDHCYAEAWDARGLQQKDPRWGAHALRTRTGAGNWAKPKAWNRAAERISDRPRVFCASLADVFDNHVSIDVMWRQELGLLIESTPHMDWMLLTKRIANARKYFPVMFPRGVPLNVWLGATIVTQAEMDRDAATLGEIKAEYGITETFFSMEPMFEVVFLNADALPDLVIVGGESGAGARPLDPQWVRPLRDHCVAAGVAFHFKQWGNWHPDALRYTDADGNCPPPNMNIGKKAAGRLLDGRMWDEMPKRPALAGGFTRAQIIASGAGLPPDPSAQDWLNLNQRLTERGD